MESMLEEETFQVDNTENVIFNFSFFFNLCSVVVQKHESWNFICCIDFFFFSTSCFEALLKDV